LLGYFLLTLLPIAAVIYVVWAYRKRTAERVAVSSKRFSEIFGSATATGTAAPRTSDAAGAPPTQAPSLKKEQLLDPQHALLFRTLASCLPGYAIFVHVSLAAVVELPPTVQGREREQRSRVLAQHAVDCLVCNRDLEVIAAVDVEDGMNAESRIKSEYLKAARVRYLRLSPAALPGSDEIPALLFGQASEKSN
jgi:hypothetical protein